MLSVLQKFIRFFIVVSLSAIGTNFVYAADTYDAVTGQLTIPLVRAFGNVYRDVVIQIGNVIAINDGESHEDIDLYEESTGKLAIGKVYASGVLYKNVLITVKKVVDVGGIIESAGKDDNRIQCQPIQDINSLNNVPVYSYSGLYSNWSNSDKIPGHVSSENFVLAFSNYSAVAKDSNNLELKSKLTDSLYKWSAAKAFVGSPWCWSPAQGWNPTCTQWIDPLGNDISGIQSNNFVMEMVESLRRSYSLISDWARINEPVKHASIVTWLKYWDDNTPNPENVFFGLGMGRYHWEIQRLSDRSGDLATASLAKKLIDGLLPLIKDDGSIVDRTSRGNRALWYHFSSINEVMTSMLLAKRAGISFDNLLEARLHKAVELFISTIENPEYIIPWASVGHNNGGDGTKQQFSYGRLPNDFTGWYDSSYAGSWIYLYVNWYPNQNNTKKLQNMVPLSSAKSAFVDRQFGIPLGCINY